MPFLSVPAIPPLPFSAPLSVALCHGSIHVPQPWGNVHLATELFNLAVHRDTAHQRQIAVGLLAAFLHVK